MPEASVVSIPAEDVPTFRELVLAEFFGLAGQIPESGHEEDRLGHAELVDEYTRIIDRLGWDGPTRTDSAIPVRERLSRRRIGRGRGELPRGSLAWQERSTA